jgi:hypothetical protein
MDYTSKIEPAFFYQNRFLLFSFLLALLSSGLLVILLRTFKTKKDDRPLAKNQDFAAELEKRLFELEQEFINESISKHPVEYYYGEMSEISRQYIDFIYRYNSVYKTKGELQKENVSLLYEVMEKCYKVQFSNQNGTKEDCLTTFQVVKDVMWECKSNTR